MKAIEKIERFRKRRDERRKNRQYIEMYERVIDPIDSSDFGRKLYKGVDFHKDQCDRKIQTKKRRADI